MSPSTGLSASPIPTNDGRMKPRRDSTSSQTAKKRELDRIAQKKSRERTKNRMLDLEDKLERLQSDDKQKQITELLKQVDDLKDENERLKEMLDKIRGVVCVPADPTTKQGNCRNQTTSPSSSEDAQDTFRRSKEEVWSQSNSSHQLMEALDFDSVMTASSPEVQQTTLTPSHPHLLYRPPSLDLLRPIKLNSFDSSLTCGTPGQPTRDGVVPDIDKWTTSDSAFMFGINSGRRTGFDQRITSSLAAYKAILWGCNDLEEQDRLHPFWLTLRQVDEKVFGNWKSKAQKVAMMFVCHKMLMYQANPSPEMLQQLPKFFRPRPSQETIQHPAIIDFFIWPGLRDRLVFSHQNYTSTGDFSAAFCENLHFHWPFPDDEILVWDKKTGSHKLSETFENYAYDLTNWTMDEGFFEKFIEMKYDIPTTKCENGLEKLFDYMPMTA